MEFCYDPNVDIDLTLNCNKCPALPKFNLPRPPDNVKPGSMYYWLIGLFFALAIITGVIILWYLRYKKLWLWKHRCVPTDIPSSESQTSLVRERNDIPTNLFITERETTCLSAKNVELNVNSKESVPLEQTQETSVNETVSLDQEQTSDVSSAVSGQEVTAQLMSNPKNSHSSPNLGQSTELSSPKTQHTQDNSRPITPVDIT